MLNAGKGLQTVSSKDLRALLRAVHRGDLTCPVLPQGLAEVGLLRLLDDLEILRGLDERGVRAALVIALAERGGSD
ncbi:MAG: hypothetical protein EA397_10325 [Deltaproteobacteria bacterium]|nr:MAG: hypothetical protein EA397_10325 [Deltaproteobacteria bacterium]